MTISQCSIEYWCTFLSKLKQLSTIQKCTKKRGKIFLKIFIYIIIDEVANVVDDQVT